MSISDYWWLTIDAADTAADDVATAADDDADAADAADDDADADDAAIAAADAFYCNYFFIALCN